MSTFPYPGLRPFRRDETDIFFGREEQVDQLLELLADHRFLAVVGPSGCGKSSLVKAGLIPGLETGFVADAGTRWRVAEMRPGDKPMRTLAEALLEESALGPERGTDLDAVGFLYSTLRRGPLGLVEALTETPLPQRTNLLILVDQFEEIFRYHERGSRNEAEAFVSLLLATAAAREIQAYVVITMRSDFLGDCARFMDLPEVLNKAHYLTPLLTREQRREAIVGPARVYGDDVEPGLVNHLLNDMGSDPDQLPLMQHALMRMWMRAREAAARGRQGEDHPGSAEDPYGFDQDGSVRLTLDDYKEVGGLGKALSNHADKALNELDTEQKRVAEILFKCLSERGADKRDTRRPVSLEEVAHVAGVQPGEVAKVIEVFRRPSRSFLTPPVGVALRPDTILDISHESLIRKWKRMNEWVEQEAESASTYRHLAESAQRWKRGLQGLLDRLALENFLDWKKRENPSQAWAKRYERYAEDYDSAMQFLGASEEKRAQELKKEETQRLAALTKTRRQLAWTLAGLFFALVLAGWAFWERGRAEHARARTQEALFQAGKAKLDAEEQRAIAESAKKLAINRADEAEAATARAVQASRRADEQRGLAQAQAALAKDREQEAKVALAEVEKANIIARTERNKAKDLAELAQQEQRKAEEAKTESAIRALATAAVDNLERDPELSLLLTLEATALTSRAKKSVPTEVVNALHQAIQISRVRVTLRGHEKYMREVVYHPSGRLLATTGADGSVRLWDASTGEHILALYAHTGETLGAAFSPDGLFLATTSSDGTAMVWSLKALDSLEAVHVLRGHLHAARAIDYSPDGSLIATGSDDGTVRIWEAASGREVRVLTGHTNSVNAVAFSPAGTRIASGSSDSTFKVWNLSTGEVVTSARLKDEEINALEFIEDGSKLAVCTFNGLIRIYDALSGRTLRVVQAFSNGTLDIAISSDGRRLAAAGFSGTVKVWDFASGEEEVELSGHGELVLGVNFSPDGTAVATASADGTGRIWTLSAGEEYLNLTGHEATVEAVAFSPDGTRLLSAGGDSLGIVFDAGSGEIIVPLIGHEGTVWDVAFSPDGKWAATAGRDSTARIWDVVSGGTRQILRGHTKAVRGIAFSPDGRLVATSSEDGTARLWDVESGETLATLGGQSTPVWDIAFSPDGRRVATANHDKTVMLWDVASGEKVATLDEHYLGVTAIAFSPDGKYLASGSKDKRVILWDAQAGSFLGRWENHRDPVVAIAFSEDSSLLATGSSDGIRIWDVASGQVIRVFSGQKGFVNAVAFKPNGSRQLAAAADDQTIRMYALDITDLIELGRARVTRAFTPDECEKFLHGPCPRTSLGLVAEARRLLGDGRSEESIKALRAATELGGTVETTPKAFVARWLTAMGLARAKSLVEEANGFYQTGKTTAAEEKMAMAHKFFTLVLQVNPNLPIEPSLQPNRVRAQLLLERGRDLAERKEIEDAARIFGLARALDVRIQLNPEQAAERLSAMSHADQGRRFLWNNEPEQAVVPLTISVKLDPTNAAAMESLGWAYVLMDQCDRATPHLERALDISATADANAMLAGCSLERGDNQQAVALATRALQINPRHGYAYWVRGLGRYNMGDYDGALKALGKVEPTSEGDLYADSQNIMGHVYHDKLFEYHAAYASFLRLIELDPKRISYRANLAEAALAAGRFTEARRTAIEMIAQQGPEVQRSGLSTDPPGDGARTDSTTPSSGNSADTRLALRFVVLSALVLEGKTQEARAALGALIEDYNEVLGKYDPEWNFEGTRHFIEQVQTDPVQRELLLNVMNVLETPTPNVTIEQFDKYFLQG